MSSKGIRGESKAISLKTGSAFKLGQCNDNLISLAKISKLFGRVYLPIMAFALYAGGRMGSSSYTVGNGRPIGSASFLISVAKIFSKSHSNSASSFVFSVTRG